MTAATDTAPEGCETVLPCDYARIGSTAVLEKDEATIRLEHALDLLKRV